MTTLLHIARSVTAAMCILPDLCAAQWRPLSDMNEPVEWAAADDEKPATHSSASAPATEDLSLRNTLLITGGAALVGAYGLNKWWQDGFTGKFRTVDEGWFAQDTTYGGADKLGHAYFTYASTRLFTRGFELAGNSKDQALKLGFWSSLGVQMGVEVLDGFSRKYRFSAQDAVMNLLGAGLGYAMETHPDLDRLLDFRLLYWPSAGNSFDPAGDYSGQTYLLVMKGNALAAWRHRAPFRYLEFAVGYGTREFGDQPPGHPHRIVYAGISLNLSELLNQAVFRDGTRYKSAQRLSDLFLEFVQVPGTALLLRDRL